MNRQTNDDRPRYWVYEGDICRAAQSTFYGALRYMKPGRMIVTMPRDKNGHPVNPGY